MTIYIPTFILIIVCIIQGSAQLLTNDNLAFTILAGTTVTINGDLLNQNGATIDNNGILQVSGNWIHNSNNDCFGTSAGTVVLNGDNQTIGGAYSTAFNNLTLTGTGAKTLLQDIFIGGNYTSPSGILSLGDRCLVLNSRQITITNNTSGAIIRTTGFIMSETDPTTGYGIIKWYGNDEASDYIYPFGNIATGAFLPVTVSIESPGFGGGYIMIATYPTITSNTPNNRPLPSQVSNLDGALGTDIAPSVIDRFWITGQGDYSTNPGYNVTFTYQDSELDNSGGSSNIIDETQLMAQQWDGFQWLLPQLGTVNTSLNSIFIPSAPSLANSVWTLAMSTNPLPVELLNFGIRLNKHQEVEIDWATASEINSDFFTIERSQNGEKFQQIGIVKSAGYSAHLSGYQFIDANPLDKTSYYRLKQTDLDGKNKFSEVKSITLDNLIDRFDVFPNPATSELNIAIRLADDRAATIRLINALGILLMERELRMDHINSSEYQISLDGLPSGIYMVQLQSPARLLTRQITVLK